MKVYRIQHRDSGHGPYWHTNPEYPREWVMGIAWRAVTHEDCFSDVSPQPAPDICLVSHPDGNCVKTVAEHWKLMGHSIRYGFPSLDAARKWFNDPDGWRLMDEWGFEVTVYSVPDEWVVHHPKQVVFSADRADILESISCADALS